MDKQDSVNSEKNQCQLWIEQSDSSPHYYTVTCNSLFLTWPLTRFWFFCHLPTPKDNLQWTCWVWDAGEKQKPGRWRNLPTWLRREHENSERPASVVRIEPMPQNLWRSTPHHGFVQHCPTMDKLTMVVTSCQALLMVDIPQEHISVWPGLAYPFEWMWKPSPVLSSLGCS